MPLLGPFSYASRRSWRRWNQSPITPGPSRTAVSGGRRNVSQCAEPVAVVVEQMRIRLIVQCGSQATRSADASAVQPSRSPVPGGRSSVCTPARPVWLCDGLRQCQGNVLIGRRSALPIVRGTNGGMADRSDRASPPAGRGGPTEVTADACPR
jgi:hypothetical protein